MLEKPLLFTACSSIPVFLIHLPFQNTIRQTTLGNPKVTVQQLCNLQTPCHSIGHQVPPIEPREAEDLPTCLECLQPI